MPTIFEQLQHALESGGPVELLTELIQYFATNGKFHELFEAKKMLIRAQLGLPLLATDSGEALDEAQREELEDALIAACREVGLLLLNDGQIRDAWHYLRAVGDRSAILQALHSLEPNEENVDQFIEICVHEGLDLRRGFRAMIDHYGTCNSITTFESSMYGRPRQDRAVGAMLLVEHVYDELLANIQGHLERDGLRPSNPVERKRDRRPLGELKALVEQFPQLTADGTYHIDTTHLASVVRAARDVEDPACLELALELCHYGERLDQALQYPGEPPFESLYADSARYFRVLLGQATQENDLEYFKSRAEAVKPREETTMVIETYVDLLARTGRAKAALQEALRLLPEDVQQTGRAPSLLELAEAADDYAPLAQISERRADPLGFAMSLLKAKSQ